MGIEWRELGSSITENSVDYNKQFVHTGYLKYIRPDKHTTSMISSLIIHKKKNKSVTNNYLKNINKKEKVYFSLFFVFPSEKERKRKHV